MADTETSTAKPADATKSADASAGRLSDAPRAPVVSDAVNPSLGPQVKTPAQTNAAEVNGKDTPEAEEAQRASEVAQEARQKADDARLSPEEREARKKEREAGQAQSRAALAEHENAPPVEPDTARTAHFVVPDPKRDLGASDHRAQKMGNDPANPKPAHHIPPDYDGPTVRLELRTPDKPEPVVTDVHPDMEGDYIRAGWSHPG